MDKDYIVFAPKWDKSAGIRVLYRLAELLQERGYNAYVFAPISLDKKANYISKISDDMRKSAIVVYPESVVGNPLRFQNVVRWVLYYPGIWGGDNIYDEKEKVFTYHKEYFPTADILYVDVLENGLFYKDDEVKKNTDSFFVYKGGKGRVIPGMEDMVEITKDYPKNRKDLADLLRRTKTLYSYDDHTLLLEEAILCGCETKIVRKDCIEDYKSRMPYFRQNREEQISKFIRVTQEMINIVPPKKYVNIAFWEKLRCYFKFVMYRYFLCSDEKASKYQLKLEICRINEI